MKILFVTAYYPPCDYGWGYMRICEQVADGLHERGHDVAVLTSTYQHGPEYKPYPVHRLLHLDPDWHTRKPAYWQFFVGRRTREKQDINNFRRLVAEFQPQVVFVWHGHGLSRAVLQVAEEAPSLETVYYFANYLPEMPDEYLHYWQGESKTAVIRAVKNMLAPLAVRMLAREGKPIRLRYPNSISVSHYVRQRLAEQNMIGPNAAVIPNGIDLSLFSAPVSPEVATAEKVKVVIAGRVAPEKGIHTVLQALGILHESGQLDSLQLNVIGDGPEAYKGRLRALTAELALDEFVDFLPSVSIEEMPQVYAQHDVLLLPSEWHEPLSCTMLEAMAAGLLVIGTNTGGSGEALHHEQTGLVFEAGDAAGLAAELARILQNRARIPVLATAGQESVAAQFNVETTVTGIENYLEDLLASATKDRLDGIPAQS